MTPWFHGPARHWAMLVVVLGLLAWMGVSGLHTHHFNLFLLALIAISAAVVIFVLTTFRKGEPVTREKLDDGGGD
jgi:predicted RND superfamily exporter protein